MTKMANASLKIISAKSSEQKQQSAISKNGLIRRLKRGKEARKRFVDSHLKKGIAFQVQALRTKKGWSQQQLAGELGSNQNAVYRLENPNYGKQTTTTLKKVAAVFDVALIARFVPFSQLVDWVTETPHVDMGLTPAALAVPSFDEEVALGQFEESTVLEQSDESSKASSRARVSHIEDYFVGKEKDALAKTQKAASVPISGGDEQGKGELAYAASGGYSR
jgi:transcriptional regulator with XRE-family HTH domain